MSKVNVNRRAKKSDMVKRSDLCIKTCNVNAALDLPLHPSFPPLTTRGTVTRMLTCFPLTPESRSFISRLFIYSTSLLLHLCKVLFVIYTEHCFPDVFLFLTLPFTSFFAIYLLFRLIFLDCYAVYELDRCLFVFLTTLCTWVITSLCMIVVFCRFSVFALLAFGGM